MSDEKETKASAKSCDQSSSASKKPAARKTVKRSPQDPFLRAANEDDDGYDPYSDRPAAAEPLFERDPWA